VDPESARLEWLERQLRSRRLARLLGRSRVFELLTAAAPGLAELVTIGKVWDLARGSDHHVVILDAPATGQGLALLAAPQTYVQVARVGPVHEQAGRIAEFLRDPASTAALGVALPEEMPVNETLDLEARLRDDGLHLHGVVANGVYPHRFREQDARQMANLDAGIPAGIRAGLRTAMSEHRRAVAQRSQLRRLRGGLEAPVSTLPFVFQPQLRPADVELLSHELEAAL
jgi:anion-transporting  ArsA/GET3 family ATPase